MYCSYIFPPTIFSRALYTGYLPCFWLKTPHAVHNALTKHKQTSLIQSFIALHTVHQQTYRFHRFITHFVLQTKKQAINIVLIQWLHLAVLFSTTCEYFFQFSWHQVSKLAKLYVRKSSTKIRTLYLSHYSRTQILPLFILTHSLRYHNNHWNRDRVIVITGTESSLKSLSEKRG